MGLGVSVMWGMSCTHLPSPCHMNMSPVGTFFHSLFAKRSQFFSSITHLKFSFFDKNISISFYLKMKAFFHSDF